LFFSTAPATSEIYTLSLHDALPILGARPEREITTQPAVAEPIIDREVEVADLVTVGEIVDKRRHRPRAERHAPAQADEGRGVEHEIGRIVLQRVAYPGCRVAILACGQPLRPALIFRVSAHERLVR